MDDRLSLREFACAMRLADLATKGKNLPIEVRADQQAALGSCIEAFVPPLATSPTTSKTASPEASTANQDLDRFGSSTTDFPRTSRLSSPWGEGSAISESQSKVRHELQAAMSQVNATLQDSKLSQLAKVLDAAAEGLSETELRPLTREVIEERKGLQAQLDRRRTDEQALQEVRKSIQDLQEEIRVAESNGAASSRRVKHLQDELDFVEGEIKSAEDDLLNLQGIDGGRGRKAGPGDQEKLIQDHQSILEVKKLLANYSSEKQSLQAEALALAEKQMHAEQDREHMRIGLIGEMDKLAVVKNERLKLQQERHNLEKELADYKNGTFQTHPAQGSTSVNGLSGTALVGGFTKAEPQPTSSNMFQQVRTTLPSSSPLEIEHRPAGMGGVVRSPLTGQSRSQVRPGAARPGADSRGLKHDAAESGPSASTSAARASRPTAVAIHNEGR
mmetsp:Transcript_58569/g.124196  ORF Transcript_58569/g.124196 Transcript_58569/m.124196 type:complete len:446 (-) Transcript_58569:105-1442(-)